MALRYLIGAFFLLVADQCFAVPCFGPDAELGVTTVPHCKTEFTDPNGVKVEVKYNKFGLRDRDYSEKPAQGTFRILVMGRYLAGRGLRDEEIPARRLEEYLLKLGFKQVEVINAANALYQAPRAAVWFRRFAQAYSPHLIIYFQTAHDFVNDFLEWPYMELNQLQYPVKYDSEKYQTYFSEMVRRLTPTNSPFFSRLSSTLIRLDILWNMYWQNRFSGGFAKPLIEPSALSLRAIVSRAGIETDFVVSLVPARVRVADVLSDSNTGVAELKYLSPRIEVSPIVIRRILTVQNGIRIIAAPGLFSAPENTALFNANARVLSAEGAERWAAGIAPTIFSRYGHRFSVEYRAIEEKKASSSESTREKPASRRKRQKRKQDFRIRSRSAHFSVFPEAAGVVPSASPFVLGVG